MFQNHLPSQGTLFLALPLFLVLFSSSSALPQTQPLSLPPSPPLPATIPAFPEQSDAAACPLELPGGELFRSVRSACGGGRLQRTRCCPVLAAWLYTAYSGTALERAASMTAAASPAGSALEMPILPDDSETCKGELEKALRRKQMKLAQPNKTCDLASCYCNIRLHPLSCTAAFSHSAVGNVAGGEKVRKLERDCLNPGLSGCDKCLRSLHQLNMGEIENITRPRSEDERVSKMHNRDCQLMGITWLLSKNTTAYFHTVSRVLKAIMMTADGSDPNSCSLNSDGMPQAVDSSQLQATSASTTLHSSYQLSILCLCFLFMLFCLSTAFKP